MINSTVILGSTGSIGRQSVEVCKRLGIKAAAALVVSDVHPTDEGAPDWHWHMDGDMRRAALERVVSAVVDEAV